MNIVMLAGNVGKAPEIRYLPSGSAVANFSIATQSRVKKNDEYERETIWHSCVAFGKLADIISEYVGSGAKVVVRGELRYRQWEDKNTQEKKYKTEIIVNELDFQSAERKEASEPQNYQRVNDHGFVGDDIPF